MTTSFEYSNATKVTKLWESKRITRIASWKATILFKKPGGHGRHNLDTELPARPCS